MPVTRLVMDVSGKTVASDWSASTYGLHSGLSPDWPRGRLDVTTTKRSTAPIQGQNKVIFYREVCV